MSALSGFINYSSGDSEISDEEDDYTSKLVKSPPSGLGKYIFISSSWCYVMVVYKRVIGMCAGVQAANLN